jgi:hypothetical protein
MKIISKEQHSATLIQLNVLLLHYHGTVIRAIALPIGLVKHYTIHLKVLALGLLLTLAGSCAKFSHTVSVFG